MAHPRPGNSVSDHASCGARSPAEHDAVSPIASVITRRMMVGGRHHWTPEPFLENAPLRSRRRCYPPQARNPSLRTLLRRNIKLIPFCSIEPFGCHCWASQQWHSAPYSESSNQPPLTRRNLKGFSYTAGDCPGFSGDSPDATLGRIVIFARPFAVSPCTTNCSKSPRGEW